MAATTRSRKPQPEQRLPNEVTIAIGKNLRRLRLAAALTQEQLAYNAEVERSRISKLESGLVNPSVLTLATICHCLGVTFPVLFKGVTATIAPLAQGGLRRRANQATLEGRGAVRKGHR
ncbi:MAG: transcriptional regulator, family [Ramlibacter sp.]|jgi:transcriptional regulator with XRE-family HTH domain|nr:transcriptional regulator, family [Ramlibacter sp.]